MPSPSSSIPNQHIGDVSAKGGNVFAGSFRNVTITSDKENSQDCLRSLMVTDPRIERRRIAENKDELLEGSCAWVFEDAAFKDWWEKDDIRCLWVHGDPGKGKTMMAMAIIDKIVSRVKQSSRHTPGGYISYFFCQGAVAGLNDAISVLRGLTFVLIIEHPELIDPLREALAREGTRLFEGNYGLHALWMVLQHILEDERVPRVYLVIDALDECSGLQDSLLHLLTRNARDLPEKVKWIITSRNEPQIKRKLENNPLIRHNSLELHSDHVTLEVREFIQVKVKDLNYDHPLRKEVEVYLTDNADGTFLWVALVCQELKNVVKRKVRSVLYKFPSGLEPLYGRMLDQIKHLPDPDDREYCIRVLRIATLAYRPLHLKEFVFAADLPEEEFSDSGHVSDLINQCGSFLTIRDEIVYFVHQSAKDFLSSTKGYRIFCTSPKDEHRLFARRLLGLMSQKLKRNICNFDHPGVLLEEINQKKVKLCIEFSVQYACCHWIDHVLGKTTSLLIETDHNNIQNVEQPAINDFLRGYCLYWLEAMTLIGKIPEAITVMMELESFLNTTNASKLRSLVRDTLRFMRTFNYMLTKAPLQLYSAGLVFSPSHSIFRESFDVQTARDIKIIAQIPNQWNECIQTLEGHSGKITSAVFSPDGSRVASSSYDKMVRVWDVQTGQCQHTLKGHSGGVTSAVFSPNGSRAASGSWDETVRVWDVQTGQCQHTLKGHSGGVTNAVFSPDGSRVSSGSWDETVRVWDVQTGQCQHTLEGHSDMVTSAVFSPDGSRVASSSYDKTVRMWDVQTGQCQHTLEGHSGGVISAVFSPDGSRVVSGSCDNTVRVWDVQMGQCQHTLEGHSGGVTSAVFSPNGSRVASGSRDETVRMWDVQTGQCQHTLKGHSDEVISAVFSPDGSRVASNSYDKTVRVWDVQTGQCQHTLKGHSGGVTSAVFSPNGSRMASGSRDETVRVWDVQTGQCQHTLEGHSDMVTSAVFSPDGSRVASGSWDETVRVWDVQTGQCQHTFEGHSDRVISAVFSPNGSRVASSSYDKTVRVWDVQTGQCQHTFEGHSDMVISAVFSPDGSRVALSSWNNTVRVWDVQTGQCQHTFEGHLDEVTSAVFSPDGLCVASGSRDETVRVWDVQKGHCQHTLKGHSGKVISAVFSPDGSRVASGSWDKTVRVWDVQTGQCQQTLKGHLDGVHSVIFSSDGSLVASSSDDKTVRVWDVAHKTELLCYDTGTNIQKFEFTDNSTEIVVNGTLISILSQTRFLNTITSISRSPSNLLPSKLGIKGDWITFSSQRILWLPPEYRPGDWASKNDTIFIGSGTGRITFVRYPITHSSSL